MRKCNQLFKLHVLIQSFDERLCSVFLFFQTNLDFSSVFVHSESYQDAVLKSDTFQLCPFLQSSRGFIREYFDYQKQAWYKKQAIILQLYFN